jgi:hypothetical protein
MSFDSGAGVPSCGVCASLEIDVHYPDDSAGKGLFFSEICGKRRGKKGSGEDRKEGGS